MNAPEIVQFSLPLVAVAAYDQAGPPTASPSQTCWFECRAELFECLKIPAESRIVEFGCGTGSSLKLLGESVRHLSRFDMVDCRPDLLSVARQNANGYTNVQVHEADAALWQPARPAHFVLMSYELTALPAWREVIANARAILEPGGIVGVMDFQMPRPGLNPFNRLLRLWFARNRAQLPSRHLKVLKDHFPDHHWYSERYAPMRHLPFLRVPYYVFLGRR